MTLRHKIQIKSLILDVQEIEEVRKICLIVLDQLWLLVNFRR